MQTLERLTADGLMAVMAAYRDLLGTHRDTLNALNVYPVPDGDTGTNLALTLESVVRDMSACDGADMASVAGALSHGSLMGARGNSGVILSQILRGLADAAAGTDGIDGGVLAAGLTRASDGAYRAVHEPVEGTILTVVRAAADAAAARPAGTGLVGVLDAARVAAADALARTPDLLPALRDAGVVDSGGAGLLLLFDAFLYVADGRPLPEAPEPSAGEGRAGAGGLGGEPGLRYEVMYLLEVRDEAVPAFRRVWAGLGDSIVVVGGGGLWNCHIHTDDIGGAIEVALDAGRPRQIRVSDLWEQVEEERWVREARQGPPAGCCTSEPVNCAVVAVCAGDGIERIFRSLGVSNVVSGGQSMNPATSDILAAVDAAPAGQVVILPNNDNVVPVAEQAARQSAKQVRVVPTHGIQEGFAALLEYDPEGDADANAELMAVSAARVVAGEVTRAVRASTTDAGPVEVGDFLGVSRRRIEVVAGGLAEAAIGLLERLLDAEHHEMVTVLAGEGSTPAHTRRITEWLDDNHHGVVTEVLRGGQPLYPYLFSIE